MNEDGLSYPAFKVNGFTALEHQSHANQVGFKLN
jgi:hypothetical protein